MPSSQIERARGTASPAPWTANQTRQVIAISPIVTIGVDHLGFSSWIGMNMFASYQLIATKAG
jgi:hypothetical protein